MKDLLDPEGEKEQILRLRVWMHTIYSLLTFTETLRLILKLMLHDCFISVFLFLHINVCCSLSALYH